MDPSKVEFDTTALSISNEVRIWIELPILLNGCCLITRSELAIEPFQIVLNKLPLKKLNSSESSSDKRKKDSY